MTPAPAGNALVLQSTPAQRLPASVVGSLALHAVILGLLTWTAATKKDPTRVISNVDLMIQVKKPVELPKPVAKSQTPASTWNFLKMALPAAPKLQAMQVKVPEHKSLMTAQPKLQDRARQDLPKLDQLDLDKKRPELNALDAKVESHKMNTAKLAGLPKLEEVGRRQVKNLPQALKMEEARQSALGLQKMDALGGGDRRAGASAAPMGEPLKDAGQASGSRFANKIAGLLPSEAGLSDRGHAGTAPVGVKQVVQEPQVAKRQAAQAMTETKKGVSIEGPLADRKVVAYDIPEFPKWARDQGVLEAQVSIRFWVDSAGNVLPNMRVEHTSGFGQLDRTAMESLKNWKFAPLNSEQRQWGVITFRFVLE